MSEMPDPATLPTERLEHEVTTLAAHLAAATCRWLLLVAELDRRQAWTAWGARSCAHWLSTRCGIGLGTARDQVRVGHAVHGLPVIRDAFAGGALSYSQVRALVRVATPENEAELVDLARHAPGAHLERIVRATLRATTEAEDRRDVVTRWDDDGYLVVRARLAPEEGALLLAAMEAVEDVSAETPEARRADAFLAVVRAAVAGEDAAIPCEISVVVEADGTGHLADGPVLDPEAVEQLRCDAAVVQVTESTDGGQLHLGRRRRTPNHAQRRALRRRDGGCRYPGCPATRYVDAHHVDRWADGGRTDLPVLVSLCRFHHRQVHLGRVLVRADGDGGFTFCRDDGRPIELADRPAGAAGAVRFVDEVDESTCVPRWGGEQLDLDLAVTAMLSRTG